MNTVSIVGVGLIGGSFGLALRKAGFEGEILGISSVPAVEAGVRVGAISRRATLEEAAAVADLIYLAQPVDAILKTLEVLGPMMRRDCLVTDAGSTKEKIVQRACASLPAQNFLGGHPLAGKEQRGAEAADADLFRDRPYVLTPCGQGSPSRAVPMTDEFRYWLRRIGARTIEMLPSEHDATVAITSHLPQLISTALAVTLANSDNTRADEVFGQGLLDMTRLSLSAPDLWQSILSSNKDEVSRAVDAFLKCLEALKNALDKPVLVPFFEEGAKFSRRIRTLPCTR